MFLKAYFTKVNMTVETGNTQASKSTNFNVQSV